MQHFINILALPFGPFLLAENASAGARTDAAARAAAAKVKADLIARNMRSR